MSITLEVVPTRVELVTPGEVMSAWGKHNPNIQLVFAEVPTRNRPPTDLRLPLGGYYGLEFSDGIEVGLFILDNVAMGCDEEGEIAEFGDTEPYADLIATWKSIGHSYDVTLSGAYGIPSIRRMEQVAGVIAGLVQGYVMVLDPWYSRPRGLYGPGTFP